MPLPPHWNRGSRHHRFFSSNSYQCHHLINYQSVIITDLSLIYQELTPMIIYQEPTRPQSTATWTISPSPLLKAAIPPVWLTWVTDLSKRNALLTHSYTCRPTPSPRRCPCWTTGPTTATSSTWWTAPAWSTTPPSRKTPTTSSAPRFNFDIRTLLGSRNEVWQNVKLKNHFVFQLVSTFKMNPLEIELN